MEMQVVVLQPNIGSSIKSAREKVGMTQKELAEKMGTTPQNISQYERNIRNPKLETRERLAEAMGLSSDTFLITYNDPQIAQELEQFLEDAMKRRLSALEIIFCGLNEDGQRVALERLDELAQLPKYQRQPAQEGQQTEQSTPGGAEDKTDQA